MFRKYCHLFCTIGFTLVILNSCKPDTKQLVNEAEGHYFSIKDFALDQWKNFHGQPYGMEKIVYMNGRKDSLITNADAVDWGAILKMFFATDISDPKYDGKYDFSDFVDQTTLTENYYYEAKDPKMFTQKLHVIADMRNHKISSIYIETLKQNKWGSRMQRLYYEPVKSISIQEFETSATGDKNEVRVEYRFL